jgi:hypothetical protein
VARVEFVAKLCDELCRHGNGIRHRRALVERATNSTQNDSAEPDDAHRDGIDLRIHCERDCPRSRQRERARSTDLVAGIRYGFDEEFSLDQLTHEGGDG